MTHTFYLTPEQIKAALYDLGPTGNRTEAYVQAAVKMYLHLVDGQVVNGMKLVPVEAPA